MEYDVFISCRSKDYLLAENCILIIYGWPQEWDSQRSRMRLDWK